MTLSCRNVTALGTLQSRSMSWVSECAAECLASVRRRQDIVWFSPHSYFHFLLQSAQWSMYGGDLEVDCGSSGNLVSSVGPRNLMSAMICGTVVLIVVVVSINMWLCCVHGCQVAAQTKHDVTLVDINDDLLTKSRKNIETSLARVAKKRFADDTAVSRKYGKIPVLFLWRYKPVRRTGKSDDWLTIFARIIRLTVQKFPLFWVIFCVIIFSLNYGTF